MPDFLHGRSQGSLSIYPNGAYTKQPKNYVNRFQVNGSRFTRPGGARGDQGSRVTTDGQFSQF